MQQTRWRILNWPTWPRRLAATGFFAAVNWSLLTPADTFDSYPYLFEGEDKLAHAAVFLALAWLVRWAVPERYGRGRARLGVLAALLIYAGAIERLQPILGGAGREFEWLDLACNLTGIAAGWVLLGAMVDGASEPPCPPARGG